MTHHHFAYPIKVKAGIYYHTLADMKRILSARLHLADTARLVKVLKELVARGNTVLVIEHNLEIIKEADYIIDLGPEGGDEGGQVVTTGSPFQLITNGSNSYTAQYLRQYLGI